MAHPMWCAAFCPQHTKEYCGHQQQGGLSMKMQGLKLAGLRLGLATAGAVIAMTAAAMAEPVVLRYNQWFPTGHWSQTEGLYPWFAEIEAATEGRVKVEPSAKPIAPPNRNYQAVVDGVADLAWGPHGYTPGVFPLTEMVELPFITEDAGKSSVAFWRLWENYFAPTGMQGDVVTLAMHVTSGGNIHMRETAVESLADLKAQKIRVPTPTVGRVLKDVGAVPVSGSLGELREMLSRGIIDGTAISDELVTGFKVEQYVKHVTRIPGGLYSNAAFVIVNKAKWEKISETDRAAILKLSGETLSEKMGALWHKHDLIAREAIKAELGDAYRDASPAFLAELKAAFQPAEVAWLEQAAKLGIDGGGALNFYRAELARSGGS